MCFGQRCMEMFTTKWDTSSKGLAKEGAYTQGRQFGYVA